MIFHFLPPARVLLPVFMLGFLAATAAVGPAAAQDKAQTVVDALPDAEIKALVETLEDATARKKLVGQLNALLAARRNLEVQEAKDHRVGAKFIDEVSGRLKTFGDQFVSGAGGFVDVPKAISWGRDQFTITENRKFWTAFAWKIVAVLGAGLIAYWVISLVLRHLRRMVLDRTSSSMLIRVPLLISRVAVNLLPLLAFDVATYGTLPFVQPDKITSLVAISLISAFIGARGVISVARTVLATRVDTTRLFPLSDINAIYLAHWIKRFANIGIYGYFLAEAASQLGLSYGGFQTIRVLVGFLIALLFIVLVLQNRENVGKWIGGTDSSEPDGDPVKFSEMRQRLADIWHVLAIIYVSALFFVWAINLEGGFALILQGTVYTVIIVTAAVLLSRAAKKLIERGLGISEDIRRRFPGLEARADRYLVIIIYGMRAVIVAAAIFAVLQGWRIDAFSWLGSDIGRGVLGSVLTISFIVILAVLVWETLSSGIERYLNRGKKDGAIIGSRARTLLPLLRTALMIALTILVILSSLSELGMDIGPLLAGGAVFWDWRSDSAHRLWSRT